MKISLPVTSFEHRVPDNTLIVSKTDLRGIITYANDAFIEISGYSREELIGRSHNIVRHPDMPPQAFKHMWDTIKSGNPWQGVVKNRSKDGGFYWVEATVVPIRRDDQTTGYMSVRKKADPDKVHQAESLYRDILAGRKTIQKQSLTNYLTIKGGFFLGGAFVIFLMIVGGILGIGGLLLSNHTMDRMFQGRLEPAFMVNRIAETSLRMQLESADFMYNSRTEGLTPLTSFKGAALASLLHDQVQDMRNVAAVLAKSASDAGDLQLVKEISNKVDALDTQGITPLERAIAGGDAEATIKSIANIQPKYGDIQNAARDFNTRVMTSAAADYAHMRDRNNTIWMVAMSGILLAIVCVIVASRMAAKNIVTPLDEAISNFDKIAQGNLTNEVDVYGKGETGQLIRASATMQLHLQVILDEIMLVAKGINGYCGNLDTTLFEVIDHSDRQNDRINEIKDTILGLSSIDNAVNGQLETLISIATELRNGLTSNIAPDQIGEMTSRLEETLQSFMEQKQLQTMTNDDLFAKLNDVADLIIDNHQEVHSAYGLSQKLGDASQNLKELVSYFEVGPSSNKPAQ
jgi:PAS domain S-box-containing protein